MLIDRFLPTFDFNEVHSLEVSASQAVVYQALVTADLSKPFIVRLLMGLRSLPSTLAGRSKDRRPITLRNRPDSFALLAEDAPREIVLGIEGRFWQLRPDVCSVDAATFAREIPAGVARAVWNFAVEPLGETRARLVTETRIRCGDEATRRKFGRYWTVIQPGSALIRLALLRQVAREASH